MLILSHTPSAITLPKEVELKNPHIKCREMDTEFQLLLPLSPTIPRPFAPSNI